MFWTNPLIKKLLAASVVSIMMYSHASAQQPRGEEIIRSYFSELSLIDRKYIQSTLAQNDLYDGAIDGLYGQNTLNGLLQLCAQSNEGSCNENDLGHPQTMFLFTDRILNGDFLVATQIDPSENNQSGDQTLLINESGYAPLGQTDLCGQYGTAAFDIDSEGTTNFSFGGEGGVVTLTEAVAVRGLSSMLYDAVSIEEGYIEPYGRLQFVSTVYGAKEVLLVISTNRTSIYEPC